LACNCILLGHSIFEHTMERNDL